MPLSTLAGNENLCRFTLLEAGVSVTPAEPRPVHNGCGLPMGVNVSEGPTVDFNRSFVATCGLAGGMAVFERDVLQPAALERFGQPVTHIEHWGTYACRNRNNATAGKRSEHARANAIDIGGFRLADGTVISVKRDWGAWNDKGRFLEDIHDGACDIFHGVLGPDADRHHTDHFHLDMGHWRFCE